MKATVEDSSEFLNISQRFLSEDATTDVDENDNNTNDGRFCEMNDGDHNHTAPNMNHAVAPHSLPNFSDYVRAGMLNGDPRMPGTQHYSR